MQVIVIGLGKMGLNLVKNYNDKGVAIIGYDVNTAIANQYQHPLFTFLSTFESLWANQGPKIVMSLLPAGDITKNMFAQLATKLTTGDVVIDFSNSFYKDSIANSVVIQQSGAKYMDCGISGGMSGARNGACMMLGHATEADEAVISLLKLACCEGGFQYYAGVGSGHYLKMVHNGIEYGMMQAIAEGLFLLEQQNHYQYHLENVLRNWSKGSIIESSLLNNALSEIAQDVQLTQFSEKISASGEANWMVKEGVDEGVPLPVIAASLMQRQNSMLDKSYGNRVVSAMRYNFGGHNETGSVQH